MHNVHEMLTPAVSLCGARCFRHPKSRVSLSVPSGTSRTVSRHIEFDKFAMQHSTFLSKDHLTLFEEDKAAVVKAGASYRRSRGSSASSHAQELQSLPHTALLRKINNLTARAAPSPARMCVCVCARACACEMPAHVGLEKVRRVRTHVIVVGYLRSRTCL